MKQGFSLIEVTIAVAVMTIVLAGASLIALDLIRGNRDNIQRLTAFSLAQEGLEAIRIIRDTHFRHRIDWLGDSMNNFWSQDAALEQGGDFIVWRKDPSPCMPFPEIPCHTVQRSSIERQALMRAAAPFQIARMHASGDAKLFLDNGAFVHISQGAFSGFSRRIKLDHIAEGIVRVKSVVEWQDGAKNLTLETELTDWKS